MTAVAASLALLAATSSGMTAIAHRGADGPGVPENSIAALERAHELGAWSEADTFLTRDRVPLVIHDARLDRTTDCTGPVADYDAAWIRASCPLANGERIPTVAGYYRTLADNRGQRLNLEVKGRGWWVDDAAALRQLDDAAERTGVRRRVYYSEDATTRLLTELRDRAPRARTAWKPDLEQRRVIRTAGELSVDAVMARPGWWTAERVQHVATAGLRPWARGANDRDVWDRLEWLGVRAALTDSPHW